MVLLLLIIIAVLLWLIQAEDDPAKRGDELLEAECPTCRKVVDIDWMVCPHCQHRLREACGSCHKGKIIGHPYCPFCGSAKGGQL